MVDAVVDSRESADTNWRPVSPSSRGVRIALGLSAWSLIFAGYLSLATVRGIGMPVTLIPALLLLLTPLGERLDKHWKYYPIFTRALVIAYLCFIPLSVMSLGLTNAVVILIIFIQFQISLHQKSEREYLLLYLMSFFLLLSACVQSPEPGIALVMVLYLLSAIWAFLTLRLYAEEQQSRALSTPEILPLDVLNPGTDSVRPSLFDRGLVGAVLALSCMAMVLTVGVFLFVPRIEAGLFGRTQSDTSVIGVDDTVDLYGSEFLAEDSAPVMYVKFPELSTEELPDPDTLYWRSTPMNYYQSTGWTRGNARSRLDPRLIRSDGQPLGEQSGGRSIFFEPSRKEISRLRRSDTESIHYTVFMLERPAGGLPLLDSAYDVRVKGGERRMAIFWEGGFDYTVGLRNSSERQIDYEAWSEIDTLDPERLAAAQGNIEENWRERRLGFDYEALVKHDLFDSTQARVRQVTQGATTPYAQAQALEAWFQGPNFLYTLKLPDMPDLHRIDYFMTETRAGHCELFATAMALSLRSLGIPARVVSGYLGAEISKSDSELIVRKSMAHLWVEAWMPEFGWTRFDPTPTGELPELSPLQRMTLLISRQRLKAQMVWYREVVGFSGGVQLSRFKEFSLGLVRSFTLPGEEEAGTTPNSEKPARVPAFIFLLIAGITTIVLVRRTRRRAPKQKWTLTDDQHRSVRLYNTLRKRLRRLGLPHTGETAGALLENLAASGRAPLDIIQAMLGVYNEVRFGHRPLTPERYGELMRQLKRLEAHAE